MFKGFYNLTSGMMTQQQRMNNVANNLTNISTPGFTVTPMNNSVEAGGTVRVTIDYTHGCWGDSDFS